MSSQSSTPSPSAATRLRRRRRNVPSHSENRRAFYLVLSIFAVFIGGIIYSRGGIESLIRSLYSSTSILILFFLILEYVLLKGRDRSRLYKIELEQLRDRHREEMQFISRSKDSLEKVQDRLEELASQIPIENPDAIRKINDEIGRMKNEFSERQTMGPLALTKKDASKKPL